MIDQRCLIISPLTSNSTAIASCEYRGSCQLFRSGEMELRERSVHPKRRIILFPFRKRGYLVLRRPFARQEVNKCLCRRQGPPNRQPQLDWQSTHCERCSHEASFQYSVMVVLTAPTRRGVAASELIERITSNRTLSYLSSLSIR
ncbi:hypothetical protein BDN67DRAFT_201926 [Paxillus ammoniavirescens]|nr:hypothetical protein BDN67DRAFT_201926 [Paxillus ammoniavirescens]